MATPNKGNKRCTEQTLLDTIASLPGAVLVAGAHPNNGACCILEARSLCLGLSKTDNPVAVGMPDIRPLNDAPWSSDEVRTRHMLRLAVAYQDWADWSEARRQAVVTRIVIATVREIVGALPRLSDAVRQQCRNVETLGAARAAAAWPAAAEAATDAAEAAEAAAWAAAANVEVADTTLVTAVNLWIAAATNTAQEG